jgi:hypothetical protein
VRENIKNSQQQSIETAEQNMRRNLEWQQKVRQEMIQMQQQMWQRQREIIQRSQQLNSRWR